MELSNPFQRIGSISNAHVGSAFEKVAHQFFLNQGIDLKLDHSLQIGVEGVKKFHSFDLGCSDQKIIVECKSHRWTNGSNIPSAKLTIWNEAMYYFHLTPHDYRKIMFVLRDVCKKRSMTLAEYYVKTHNHLVPKGVEFLEYDEVQGTAKILRV